ncbi:MAG: SUMF1/EgtB/PvdO family nonheme iron enzyme [Woeseiaceae bacterium]
MTARQLVIAVPASGALAATLLLTVPWPSGQSATACYQGPPEATATVPAGRFAMGSEHYPEEGPVVEVAVVAFDIDRHEVTNAQFRRFVAETGYITSAERATELGFEANGSAVFADARWAFVPGADWRHPEGPDSTIEGRDFEPVVQVSFEDAGAYAGWAGRALPSERQWEYAARAGLDGAEYAWGDTLTPGGEYRANTWQGEFPASNTGGDGFEGRAPVGCFEANSYGLYDMIGNVWEWTADPYQATHVRDDTHEHAGSGFDPRQPGVPVGVIKGGSFLCAENFCRRYRPAARHPQDTQLGTNHLGFRTVGVAATEGAARAYYLANEGVMVANGETKVLFDPLFNESFGEYRLVPEEMRRALMAGEPPWDGMDAVFVSHYHDDHFSPRDMLAFLGGHGDIRLYAPEQAVIAMREVAEPHDDVLLDRVTAVALEYGDAPRKIEIPGLLIEAVRIPHTGWPTGQTEVENIAWRITLDNQSTVLHLGDADTDDVHFEQDGEYWDRRLPDMAFPPYWYFLSENGLRVLRDRLRPAQAVGIHVPVTVPDNAADREPALQDVDLFTRPGETREITHEH